ncbi:hypothetical protein [Aquabacterium sp.]|uniref:hypothetical protein n=1 Tax=Aquabacterium sp. TaxID=1872578 RepID=UPI0040382B5D
MNMPKITKVPEGLEGVTVTELPEGGDVVKTATSVAQPVAPKGSLDPEDPLSFFQANDHNVSKVEAVPGHAGTYQVFY